jgi:hypothetical protein
MELGLFDYECLSRYAMTYLDVSLQATPSLVGDEQVSGPAVVGLVGVSDGI